MNRKSIILTAATALAMATGLAVTSAQATTFMPGKSQNCHGGPHGETILICEPVKDPMLEKSKRRWHDSWSRPGGGWNNPRPIPRPMGPLF